MTSTFAKTEKSTLPSVAEDPRWARIVARDKTADGHLWYSVYTTGVYCRPSCASRTANPKNVQLHDTLESAKATGFRPCKRCNPDGPSIECENAALVARACRIIEENEEEPSLEVLAAVIGRSPTYFHRLFKAATGVTPHRPPRGEGPAGTGFGQQRHRSHLRRGFQFERALLREVDRHARHDPIAVPRGRCQRGDQVRGWPDQSGRHFGRLEQERRRGHPSRRRSGQTRAQPSRPLPEGASRRCRS